MKVIIRTLTILCVAFLATVLVGCENTKGNTDEKAETFNILLDDEAKEYGIKLSDKGDFSSTNDSYLISDGFKITNTSFAFIDFGDTFKTNGLIKSEQCFAYTIYVKNEGSDATSVVINLNVKKETKDFGKAIRIGVIEDGCTDEEGNVTFNKGIIYLKNDGHGDEVLVEELKNNNDIKTFYDLFKKEFFNDDNCFGSFQIENVGVNESRKITMIFWIEGFDMDCTNEIIGGELFMEYVVSIKK